MLRCCDSAETPVSHVTLTASPIVSWMSEYEMDALRERERERNPGRSSVSWLSRWTCRERPGQPSLSRPNRTHSASAVGDTGSVSNHPPKFVSFQYLYIIHTIYDFLLFFFSGIRFKLTIDKNKTPATFTSLWSSSSCWRIKKKMDASHWLITKIDPEPGRVKYHSSINDKMHVPKHGIPAGRSRLQCSGTFYRGM